MLLLNSAATLLVAQDTGNNNKENDATLDALIAQIPKFSRQYDDGVWLTSDRDALAEQIRAFKAAAVPRMLAFLSSKREGTRYFAGLVLRDLEGLTEDNLDALIAAHRRGERLAIPAIGRIGTPRAIAYVVSTLPPHYDPEIVFLVRDGLALSADQSAPVLAGLFRDTHPLRPEWDMIAPTVFSKTSDKGAAIALELASIAGDETVNLGNRKTSLRVLGLIGLPAAPVVPALKELARADPKNFSEPARSAIIDIGTTDAVEFLLPRLADPPLRSHTLTELGALKENGERAGPDVAALLKDENDDVRVLAAETIGYINYADGAGALREILSDTTDWHLVFAAAESLGRLRDAAAIDALRKVEREHDVAFVRDAATKAIQAIEGTATYDWDSDSFYDVYRLQPSTVSEAQSVHDSDALTKSELERMKYERPSYVPDWLPERIVPDCGLRVGKSVLLAGDRGEFGGELVLVDEAGRARMLYDDNIGFLHKMPRGIVAVGGLAHMGIRYGSIYRVDFRWTGKPYARRWKSLPGPPDEIRLLEDGSLLVRAGETEIIMTLADDVRLAAEAKVVLPLVQLIVGGSAIAALAYFALRFKRAADRRRSLRTSLSLPGR